MTRVAFYSPIADGAPRRRHLLPENASHLYVSERGSLTRASWCAIPSVAVGDGPEVAVFLDPSLQIVDEQIADRILDALGDASVLLLADRRHCCAYRHLEEVLAGERDERIVAQAAGLREMSFREGGFPENAGLCDPRLVAYRLDEWTRLFTGSLGSGLDLAATLSVAAYGRDHFVTWTSKIDADDASTFRRDPATPPRAQGDFVTAIMPCRGRVAQTLTCIEHLQATAGESFELICVVDDDPEVADAINKLRSFARVIRLSKRGGYWNALRVGTNASRGHQIVNLANDVLPGHRWLARARETFREKFGEGEGLVGLNDGLHGEEHSCHFLIDRSYLARLGGWPTWYDHNYGDTELCARARSEMRYAKSPWAVLYHHHWAQLGKKLFDRVYAEGGTHSDRDQRLFGLRQAAGWPDPVREEAKFRACVNMSRVRMPE